MKSKFLKLYDRENKRLIVLWQKATPEYWDRHWQTKNLVEKITEGRNNWFVRKFTSKFLKKRFKSIGRGLWNWPERLRIKMLGDMKHMVLILQKKQ